MTHLPSRLHTLSKGINLNRLATLRLKVGTTLLLSSLVRLMATSTKLLDALSSFRQLQNREGILGLRKFASYAWVRLTNVEKIAD